MTDLKNKAVNSVKWNTINSIANIIISPLVLITLARILTLYEYGQIAIVTIVIGFSKKIATMGFAHAIIQEDNIQDGDLSSVFWFEQVLGILVFLIIYIFSPIIADLFNAPETISLIKFSSFVFLFEPIDLVFRALLKKDLKYSFFIKTSLIRLIFTQTSKIIFAILGYGAMSVVIGNLIGIFVLTIIMFTYFIYNNLWLPKFYFSFKQLRPYLKFGLFVFGKSFLDNLFKYIDEIIIGGYFGTEILGVYHFSKNLVLYLSRIFNHPISEVGLPLLSKLKNDISKLNNTYIKIVKYISTLSVPAHVGVSVLAGTFIPIFFGEKWNSAIPLVIILAFWGLFKSLYDVVITSVLYALGKSDIMFYENLIDIIIRSILLFSIRSLGISYIAVLLVFIGFVKFIVYQVIIKYYTGLKISILISKVKTIFISSLVMLFFVLIFKNLISFELMLLNLVVYTSIGILTYGFIMLGFEKEYLIEIYNLIKINF